MMIMLVTRTSYVLNITLTKIQLMEPTNEKDKLVGNHHDDTHTQILSMMPT